MLFVFGVLTVKAVFADSGIHGNCDEFGHLHFQTVNSLSQDQDPLTEISSQADTHESCHEGKVLAGYPLGPQVNLDLSIIVYQLSFDLELKLDRHFKSPYLEPRRKPPKPS